MLRKYSGGTEQKRIEIIRGPKATKPPHLRSLTRQHKRYLQGRRFPRSIIELWALKGTTYLSGDWNWRIITPIKGRGGDTQAYIGRTIAQDVRPKYKVSHNKDITVSPASLLYGINKVPGDTIVIVEGPTDVWRLGPGAVAVLGIDWKTDQANLLRRFARRFIMFDPEADAAKKAIGLARWLSLFQGSTEVIDDLRCDPGDMTNQEARKIMRSFKI